MNERLHEGMQTADDHAPPAPDFAGAEAQIAAEKEILGALARQRDAAAIERLAVNAVKAIEAEGRPVSVVAHLAALRLCDELGQNRRDPLPTAPGRRRFDRVIFDACMKAYLGDIRSDARSDARSRRTA